MDTRGSQGPSKPSRRRPRVPRATPTHPSLPGAVLEDPELFRPLHKFIIGTVDREYRRTFVYCRFCRELIGRLRGLPPVYYPETARSMGVLVRKTANHMADFHPKQFRRMIEISRKHNLPGSDVDG